jgi:hypothetical protein
MMTSLAAYVLGSLAAFGIFCFAVIYALGWQHNKRKNAPKTLLGVVHPKVEDEEPKK